MTVNIFSYRNLFVLQSSIQTTCQIYGAIKIATDKCKVTILELQNITHDISIIKFQKLKFINDSNLYLPGIYQTLQYGCR